MAFLSCISWNSRCYTRVSHEILSRCWPDIRLLSFPQGSYALHQYAETQLWMCSIYTAVTLPPYRQASLLITRLQVPHCWQQHPWLAAEVRALHIAIQSRYRYRHPKFWVFTSGWSDDNINNFICVTPPQLICALGTHRGENAITRHILLLSIACGEGKENIHGRNQKWSLLESAWWI